MPKENQILNKEQMGEELFWFSRKNWRTNKEAAKALGTNNPNLSLMIKGHRNISDTILNAMGYEKFFGYRKKNDSSSEIDNTRAAGSSGTHEGSESS